METHDCSSDACLFCGKVNGIIKKFDKETWHSLKQLAIARSEENLVGPIGATTRAITGTVDGTSLGYHRTCYRKYVSFKTSKRKRDIEIISPEVVQDDSSLPAVSNTLVARIFSVASRTFADLSDLIVQLHPQEDLQSRNSKYSQKDVDLLYRAVADFGDNIKQITENLRQRHTDQIRTIQAQEKNINAVGSSYTVPIVTPSYRKVLIPSSASTTPLTSTSTVVTLNRSQQHHQMPTTTGFSHLTKRPRVADVSGSNINVITAPNVAQRFQKGNSYVVQHQQFKADHPMQQLSSLTGNRIVAERREDSRLYPTKSISSVPHSTLPEDLEDENEELEGEDDEQEDSEEDEFDFESDDFEEGEDEFNEEYKDTIRRFEDEDI